MKITILLFDGVTALDAIGAYDPLARLPKREITFVSLTGAPASTGDHLLTLHPCCSVAEVERTDILLVPGGGGEGLRSCMGDVTLKAELTRLDGTSTITASVCTGSLILASAGLLRGRRATTNWRAKDHLRPFGATYTGERITVDGKYWTSAGVTAGIDLGLRLCERIAGRNIAQAAALAMEYAPEPPFGTGNAHGATLQRRRFVETVLNG